MLGNQSPILHLGLNGLWTRRPTVLHLHQFILDLDLLRRLYRRDLNLRHWHCLARIEPGTDRLRRPRWLAALGTGLFASISLLPRLLRVPVDVEVYEVLIFQSILLFVHL